MQRPRHYWKGADIGWATEYESHGLKFYNREGQERECTALMKELGLGAVRFRVWVDPSKYGNWNSKEDLPGEGASVFSGDIRKKYVEMLKAL